MKLLSIVKYMLPAIALGGLTACQNGTSNTGSTAANISDAKTLLANKHSSRKAILKSNYEVPVQLGDGFDSRTGMGLGLSCLANAGEPDSIVLSNPQGSINFTDTISIEQISNILNTSIEGETNLGLFSASTTAKYTRDSMDTRQSLNFNYMQTMASNATFTVKGLGKNILSSDAQDVLANGMDDFTSVCGDAVVQSAKQGAVLVVDVSIKFANASLKQKFEGSAKGSIAGIGSISGAFSNEQNNSTKNATLSVKAYQVGGDPTKLAKIFGKPNQQGQYNIVECSSENINACKNIVNDIVAYAQNDFQTSVDFKKPNTLYTYEYNTKLYSKYGVKASLPILTPEEQASREYLTNSITQDREMLNYLLSYQKQSFYNDGTIMDYITKNDIAQAIRDYTTMINNYNNYNIIDSCYGDTENINTRCVYAANQVRQMRTKFGASIAIASNLSGVVVFDTMDLGITAFISIRDWNSVNLEDLTSSGVYLAYDENSNKFLPVACVIDTTFDNSFFKAMHPELTGKSVQCYGTIRDAENVYVNGTKTARNLFGLAGRLVNGIPVNYPLRAKDYNTNFTYSDASNFKYNPI